MSSPEHTRPTARPDHSQVIPGSTLEVNFDIPDWMKDDPLDVNQPFDWATEAENAADSDDTKEDNRSSDSQAVEADAIKSDEDIKPKNRFSQAFARAKATMTIDESRWTAGPAEPHVQALDATDTWQDPFEKFYGPSGPVKEYTAVPSLKQKAKKTETDANNKNSSDDTPEKQGRIKAATEKVLGAWALEVDKHVNRFYDSVDLQSALIDSLKTFEPTAEDKEEIAEDVKEAEAEQKRLNAQERAERRAARKQTVKTQVVAAKEAAKKLPTKEAKKLATKGVMGAVALGGAAASKANDRFRHARVKRKQTTTKPVVASPAPAATEKSAPQPKPKDDSYERLLDEFPNA